MIKDKKCKRPRREGGFPFDFRTLQNRERGGGGGGGDFFVRRPKFLSRNETFLQLNWRYLTSYLHSLDAFS